MTDRSDKTHSPGDNTLANLYAAEHELELNTAVARARLSEYSTALRNVRRAIKTACGDSMAKL